MPPRARSNLLRRATHWRRACASSHAGMGFHGLPAEAERALPQGAPGLDAMTRHAVRGSLVAFAAQKSAASTACARHNSTRSTLQPFACAISRRGAAHLADWALPRAPAIGRGRSGAYRRDTARVGACVNRLLLAHRTTLCRANIGRAPVCMGGTMAHRGHACAGTRVALPCEGIDEPAHGHAECGWKLGVKGWERVKWAGSPTAICPSHNVTPASHAFTK
jgi:hypothetical protein